MIVGGSLLCFPTFKMSAFFILAVLDGVERLTAEEMDERRQQNMAYEYLCHLEEAKRSDLFSSTRLDHTSCFVLPQWEYLMFFLEGCLNRS